jgi:hypothetical protein
MAYSASPTTVTGFIAGVAGYSRKTGTAAVASAAGVYAQLRNENASGAITNGYGVYIAAPILTGAITNEWGVYQASTAGVNYFAGRTDIRVARGAIFQDDTLATTVITLQSTYYPIQNTWADEGGEFTTRTVASGQIIPTVAGTYRVFWAICGEVDANNQILEFHVFKSGAGVLSSAQQTKFIASGDTYGISGGCYVSVNGTTDYIDLRVFNSTSAGKTFTVEHAYLSVERVGP